MKKTPEEKNPNEFRAYFSSVLLQVFSFIIPVCSIFIGIFYGRALIQVSTINGIIVILAGVIFGIAIGAALNVLSNMSDDQKYIAETMEYFMQKNDVYTNESLLNQREQNALLRKLVPGKQNTSGADPE